MSIDETTTSETLFYFLVGPLFASSLLTRLHIMMTTMLGLTLLTLVAIIVVIQRLRPLSTKLSSNDLNSIHDNHCSSPGDENNGQTSALTLSSKNCYLALVQNDDEQHDCLLEKKSATKRTLNHNSNADLVNSTVYYDTSSTNIVCVSDEQHRTA
jgi:hypothetical protein